MSKSIVKRGALGTLAGTLALGLWGMVFWGWLLAVGPSRYAKRAGVVFLAGIMGTNFISVADPIWFHLPWDYTVGVLLYQTVSWALLAGVTAGIVRVNLVRA